MTTLLDLYPFNGARHCTIRERSTEAGVNALLMSLASIGFIFRIHGLMLYGLIYYFVLFAVELIIWWVPCLSVPTGRWRLVYNRLLSVLTSHSEPGDTLDHWVAIHERIHSGTFSLVPKRPGRITPNLEHMILQILTLVTAILTLVAYRRL